MKLATEHYFNGSTQNYAGSDEETFYRITSNSNNLWVINDYLGLDPEAFEPDEPNFAVYNGITAGGTSDNGERQVYNLRKPSRTITKITVWLYWAKTVSPDQPTVDLKIGTTTLTAQELTGSGGGWESVTFDGVWTASQFTTDFQVGLTCPTLSSLGFFAISALYVEVEPVGYDATKTNLGRYVRQTTINSDDSYVSVPSNVVRPLDSTATLISGIVEAINAGNGIHWVFAGDSSSATATRTISLSLYDTNTGVFSFKGYITLTYPTATNHTMTGLAVARHLYTTGTVGATGTAVTGDGNTDWFTARYAAGARIGFGSTDPNEITRWYYISTINSDSSITLTSSVDATVDAGTPFVIDELRIYTCTTNATATNGGLFVTKGVTFDDFKATGTTISAATTADNVKAVYWLADASTVTNTTANGLALGTQSDTSQFVYVGNGETSYTQLRMYKYDGRKGLLSLSSGKSTTAYITKTQPQTAPADFNNFLSTNSLSLFTTQHGPGAGKSCIYGIASRAVYRMLETTVGAAADDPGLALIADYMLEAQPYLDLYVNSDTLGCVNYDTENDRLVVSTRPGDSKVYVGKYDPTGTFSRVFGSNKNITNKLHTTTGVVPSFNPSSSMELKVLDGMLYAGNGTNTGFNAVFAVPLVDIDAEGTSASTQSRLITPSLSTPNCARYSKVTVNADRLLGISGGYTTAEPYLVYVRTSGIDDDSGAWTLVDETGDISDMPPSGSIQVMIEFRMFGPIVVSPRIRSLMVTYEGNTNDSHYQPSASISDHRNKSFVWRFATAFNLSTTPALKIKYFDAKQDKLLFEDTTTTMSHGTFTKSTNGGSSWVAYNTEDKANETTYIRYIPTAGVIPDNVVIRAFLSLENPNALIPDFSASSTSGTIVVGSGYSVTFTDRTLGNAVSWLWDFGDGNTSTEQNPTHTYWKGGTFDVSLTVYDANQNAVETKTEYIVMTDPLDAGPRWGWGGDPTAELVLNGEGDPRYEGTYDINKRIPILGKTPNGTLIIAFQGSVSTANDFGTFSVKIKRSTDYGVTWTEAEDVWNNASVVYDPANVGRNARYIGLGAIVTDRVGMGGNPPSTTLMMFEHLPPANSPRAGGLSDSFKCWISRSEDDGVTWSAPTDITSSIDNHLQEYSFVAANVNTTSNVITLDATPPANTLFDGMAVVFTTSGTLPAPLLLEGPGGSSQPAVPYYIKMTSSNTFTVHTTEAGGLDGSSNIVDLSTQGTGTHKINMTWYWIAMTSKGIQLDENSSNPGRLIIAGDHRTGGGGTGASSFMHCIYSDDGGITWAVLGKPLDKNANSDQNESCIIATTTPNKLLVNSRNTGSNSFRWQAYSVDGGVNWTDIKQMVYVGAATNVQQTDTWGSIERLGDTLIVSGPLGTPTYSYRKNGILWYSKDEGLTWTARSFTFRYCGYSEIIALDDEHLLIIYESATNSGYYYNNYQASPYLSLKMAVVSKNWITSSTPLYADYFFNEQASGVVVNPYGDGIIDYGYMDARGHGGSVDNPTYYSSSGIALNAASPNGICVSTPIAGGNYEFQANTGESMTYEVEATCSSNGILISNFINGKGFKLECAGGFLKATVGDGSTTITATGATTTINDGVRRMYTMVRDGRNGVLKIYIDGILEASAADTTGDLRRTDLFTGVYMGQNTFIPFNIGSADNVSGNVISFTTLGENLTHGWADGQAVMFTSVGKSWGAYTGGLDTALSPGTVYFVRTTGLSAHQIQVHPTSADAIANTNVIALAGNGDTVGTVSYVMACPSSAPYNLQGTLHSLRVTRAAKSPTEFVVKNRAKTPIRTHRNNFSVTLPAFDPTDISSLHSWWHATIFKGENFWGDNLYTYQYPLPWPNGASFRSCRDIKNGHLIQGTDSRPARYYTNDTNVGRYCKLFYNVPSGAASFQALAGLTTPATYDYVFSAGPNGNAKSTVACAIRWDSAAAGGSTMILDTTYDLGGSRQGFAFYRTSLGKIHVYFNDGSTPYANFDFSPTFNLNTWYFIMMAANGYGANMTLYYTTLSGTYNEDTPYTPASCSTATGAVGTPTGTPTNYWRPTIGVRGDASGSYNADISIKNFMLFNNTLGLSDADNLAAFCVKG